MKLHRVGIVEREEGIGKTIGEALRAAGKEEPCFVLANTAQALGGEKFDLVVVSPGAAREEVRLPPCRTVLLPGTAKVQPGRLCAGGVVSYGTSSKDTVTVSSLEGGQICIALQRELVTLDGAVVERQELLRPFLPGTSPLCCLAAVGAQLLLGAHADAPAG